MASPARLPPTDGPAVYPVSVTQLTSEAVLGIGERRFRELVAQHKIRHVRLGKLVVVRTADWLDALERLGRDASPEPEHTPATPTVDDYLARLGRVRT